MNGPWEFAYVYVCLCHGVTDKAIRQAAAAGASSLAELAQTLRVATCCGKCADMAQTFLQAADRLPRVATAQTLVASVV